MSAARRALAEARGFVFDLDGCVWMGEVLVPGAAEVLGLLRSQGRGVCFLTNNSRARAQTLQAKLERLGIQAATHDVLTPLEILGEVIAARFGPSRVLAIGGPELEQAVLDGGHSLVPVEQFREAAVATASTMAPQPGRKSPSSSGSRGSMLGVRKAAPPATARAAAVSRS